jgi:hypothetical protein
VGDSHRENVLRFTDVTQNRILRTRNHTEAAIFGAIDYKRTFARTYASDEEQLEAYSQCHLRSAKRVLRALLANGGKGSLSFAMLRED